MTFSVTVTNYSPADSQVQLTNWLSKPARRDNNDTLDANTVEIMIHGKWQCFTYDNRHAIMRYGHTHISFFPESRACLAPGIFKTPDEDLRIGIEPHAKLFRITFQQDQNAPININETLNNYFGHDNLAEGRPGIVAWTIPDIKARGWFFKCIILTCCGTGCFIEKANCTSIIVNALSRIGITTDLCKGPSIERTIYDTITCFGIWYLCLETLEFYLYDDDDNLVIPIASGIEVAVFMLYLFIVNIKTNIENDPINSPTDNERNRNCNSIWRFACSFQNDLQLYTNASRLLMILTSAMVLLDVLSNAIFGTGNDIITHKEDSIMVGNIRLTDLFLITLFSCRLGVFAKTLVTNCGSGPQNPFELSQVLERVATLQPYEVAARENPIRGPQAA